MLLLKLSLRTNQHEALPHLNSVVIGASTQSPCLIITQNNPICLMTSILNLLQSLLVGQHRNLYSKLITLYWTQELAKYLEQLANEITNDHLRRNWFVRLETHFILSLLKCSELREHVMHKKTLQQNAYKMSTYLTENQVEDVVFLFESVLFKMELYDKSDIFTDSLMNVTKQIYQHICFDDIDPGDDYGMMVSNHDKLVLAAEWPYLPVLKVLRSVTDKRNADEPGKTH